MQLPSGIQNLVVILDWVWWVMRCQVQPDVYCQGEGYLEQSSVYPTWEWAAWEGIFSTRRSPWHWQASRANRIYRDD